MDIQLQELIDKIKKDGIESASTEAGRIKAEAEAEAKRIIDAAKKEAAALVERGKADAERSEKAGIAAVQQASRNLILSFKDEIQNLLNKIIEREVTAAYQDDTLKTVIPEVLKAWASKNSNELNLLLNPEALGRLESYFTAALSAELKKGLELKADRTLGAGFRIAGKDGSAYYDFSASAVAELMSLYLNPRLAEVLSSAAKGL